jgi:hypothetical protein
MISQLLTRARAAAEAAMTDTCTVKRVTGQTFNEETGQHTPTFLTVYSGKCRVRAPGFHASSPTTGQATTKIVIGRVVVWLPVSTSAGVKVDDDITITAAAFDGALTGRVFRVSEQYGQSHSSSRRFVCTEVQT